ncbi:sensor histidine kinase [Luteococcus sp. OSA5]|uniref:sensor histidine kinase n=1 Tax=Luteococcus sp. OSA5 TaxID=3401630 RepID=UPI003B42CE71
MASLSRLAAGGGSSPSRVVRRWTRSLALAAALVVYLISMPAMVASIDRTPLAWVAVACFLVHLVMLFVAMLRKPLSSRWFWSSGAVLVLAFLTLMPQWADGDGGQLWAPGGLGMAWCLWATMVLPPRVYPRVVWGIFAALGLMNLGVVWFWSWPAPRHELLVSLWFLLPGLVVMLLGDALRRVAHSVELQIAEREGILTADGAHRAELYERAEAARLLHDHVLHALHAISRIGDGEVTAQMAQEECRVALHELARPRATEPAASVRDLLRADELVQSLGIEPRGDAGAVPVDVAHAMAAAAHEALLNASAHAKANTITVELRDDPAQRVVVRDDGVGFRPDRVPSSRLGLRSSVRELMAALGGAARVTSAPGQGTEVVLSWPLPEASQPEPAWVLGTQRLLRRLLVRSAWPALAAALVAIPVMAPLGGGWPVVLVVLPALVIGAWYSWYFIEHPPSERMAGLVFVASVLVWSGWVTVGPGLDKLASPHDLWPMWVSAALLHLVVLSVRVRLGLVAVAGWVLLVSIGVLLREPDFAWFRLYPIVVIPLIDVLMTIALLDVFVTLASEHFTQRALAEESRQRLARLRHSSQLQDHWSQQVTGEAMPLMRAVAAEGSVVTREQIDQALLLEATLRDELILGPDEGKILAVLNTLRRDGWHINTPSVHPAERVFLDAVAHWTALIGKPDHFKQEVKVTLSHGIATLVVLDPNDEQVALWTRTAGQLGAQLDSDEGWARLRMKLPDKPRGTY